MSKIGKLRQRLGAFDFTEPLNKNNELGRRLRKKRIDKTQPHIGMGEPYKRKGRVVWRSPPSRDFYNTLPFEPTKPGTMEEDQYERQLTKKFSRPKIREKDRKPGTLFDNEGGLQDREFAADSLDDPSILDPEKWSGEDLKKLEDMTATPSLTNYTHKQPLRDSFIQEYPGGVGISDPYPNFMDNQTSEEMKYVKNPQHKIKPIKPTRMEWRAIISAKQLRQRIAQVRLAVTYGKGQSWLVSPEVINAFKNREPFRLHQKQKGRNAEYAFQTDGDTLFQLSKKEKGLPQKRYEIASWDEEEDLNWSFEGRDSASTIQAGKMLGLDIKRKEGKMFVNGEYMDHLTREKPMKIPRANLKGEYKSKTRSKITPKQYEDTKAQTRFRQRSESYWKKQKGILGDQITDPETGEIYDQASIQPYQQRQINKTLGLSEEHDVGEKIIGDEYDHPIPARIVKKIGGSRDFGIGTPLSHKTHIEREDPASTIPKAFRRRIQKARLKIARLKLAFRGKRSMGKPLPKLGIPFKGGNVDNIINTWKRNPLSRRQKGGYTFDPVNNEFLDASNRKQALKIRSVFKAEKGKNFGINSITDTKKGVEPVRNINRIHKELYDIENNNDIPIIGGYEDSLEASYPVSGSNRDILKRLNKNQKESLIIEPDGLAYTEDRKGKRTTLTKD